MRGQIAMWTFPGRFRCSKCGTSQGIWRRALRSPFRSRIGVCRGCLSLWERTGHRCGQCWYPIQATWDLGLLLDREVFAHVDCGGALLLPLGWSGRFTLPASIRVGDAFDSGPMSKGRRPGEEAAGKLAASTLSPGK
jgi:hypothetical protein